jgi:cytochrome bd-type quinol oxidase subunit 2
MSSFYMLTTPFSVLLIVVATIFTDMYPELFEKDDKQPMEIHIDESSNTIMAFMILTVFAVLFIPLINFIFSVLYSGQILIEVYRLKNKRNV